MPYLNDWIKAQLKGGYTKQQIKQFLARKGYTPTAVAQVDKIKPYILSNKKIPKNFSKIFSIGRLVQFILIIGLVTLYRYRKLNQLTVE
ncbi:hypothetical protein HYV83_02585 [Candidatus Woesearchaeota archaeon]|nr:hypothetical protein [Candidatus Woesearchaeota archaeon]